MSASFISLPNIVFTTRKTKGTGTDRTQRIVIYYRFVGYLELPQEQTYTAETRQPKEL